MNDVLEEIGSKLSSLSKKEYEIGMYILKYWQKSAHQSSLEISKELGTSQASVVRAAKSLGFSGFSELQKTLQKLLHQRLSLANRMERSALSQTVGGVDNIITKTFKTQEDNLVTTMRNLNPQYIVKIVEYIVSASKIYIVGMRSSASIAHFLGFNLHMITSKVNIITNDYCFHEDMNALTKKDLLIIIGFPRYARLTKRAIDLNQNTNCKIVSITDNLASPIAQGADIVLTVATESTHFNQSYVAALALCDIILAQLVTSYPNHFTQALTHLEKNVETTWIY